MGQIIAKPSTSQIEPKTEPKSEEKPKQPETPKKAASDDHYENLESMRLDAVPQSPKSESPSVASEEKSKPISIKVPKDTRTKVDPYSARYDTLLMIPDVQWDKNQQQQQQQSQQPPAQQSTSSTSSDKSLTSPVQKK